MRRDRARAPSSLDRQPEQARARSCVGTDRTDDRRDPDHRAVDSPRGAVISSAPARALLRFDQPRHLARPLIAVGFVRKRSPATRVLVSSSWSLASKSSSARRSEAAALIGQRRQRREFAEGGRSRKQARPAAHADTASRADGLTRMRLLHRLAKQSSDRREVRHRSFSSPCDSSQRYSWRTAGCTERTWRRSAAERTAGSGRTSVSARRRSSTSVWWRHRSESLVATLRELANGCEPSDCRPPPGASLAAGIGLRGGSRPDEQASELLCTWLDRLPSVGYWRDRLDRELQPRRHDRPSADSEASAPGDNECVGRHLNCSDVREHQVLLRA